MSSVLSAIENIVPISQFNRGFAGKIFSDVKKHGPKVVIKNNSAEAVIVSPAEYVEIQDELNDYRLLTLAVERMSNYKPNTLISQKDMAKRMNITAQDLDSVDEAEFE